MWALDGGWLLLDSVFCVPDSRSSPAKVLCIASELDAQGLWMYVNSDIPFWAAPSSVFHGALRRRHLFYLIACPPVLSLGWSTDTLSPVGHRHRHRRTRAEMRVPDRVTCCVTCCVLGAHVDWMLVG